MTLYASADLLSDFKYLANRSSTDAANTDAQIYRLLTLAQQQVAASIVATFPRMMMTAPSLLTTADGGYTYQINATDEDGDAVTPFGHAEVYGRLPNGGELYGASYGGGLGDIVLEGNTIRIPSLQTRTFSAGPYIRYNAMPGTLSASSAPTLKPANARQLIVYRALELWSQRGGTRDPRPYREMYATAWSGSGAPGDHGILGQLATQYRGMNDAAMEGIYWWRNWVAQGGSGALSGFTGLDAP